MQVSKITVILIDMQEYNSNKPYVDTGSPERRYHAASENEVNWRDLAACKDVDDSELFFPVGKTRAVEKQVERAKLVCNACSVRAGCLAWAMNHHQDSGIWGGLTEDERRTLKRNRSGAARVRNFGKDVIDNVTDLK